MSDLLRPDYKNDFPRTEPLINEKRDIPRKKNHDKEKFFVEISLPFPKGAKIRKDIIDLAQNGLSFKMLGSEGYFLPGTSLNSLAIFRNESLIARTSGEVVYALAFNEDHGECYRIGVQLNMDQKRRSALSRRKSLPHQIRPLRYSDDIVENLSKLIIFSFNNKQEISHRILNFSKYGLAFQLAGSGKQFKLGSILESLQVVVNDEIVYSGEATIVNLREDGGDLIVGVALRGKLLDIEKIFSIQRTKEATRDLIDHIKTFFISNKIDLIFKTQIADLRYFLEKVKKTLDTEENSLKNEPSGIKKIMEKNLLTDVGKEVFKYLDQFLEVLNTTTKNFSVEQHRTHKEYFQSHLHPLLLQSPFILRCFTKPLGYPGDYEMMDMIYRDPDEGESLFGRLLNIYSCHHIRPAQASRNRIPYLLNQINRTVARIINEGKNQRVKITSVACGPSNEVRDFIGFSSLSSYCDITLIDIEPEALYSSQERLLSLKTISRFDVKISFQNKSIKQLIQEAKKSNTHPQHLIYSAGLFEYLEEALAKKLIQVLYNNLYKQGTLIIGNFDPSNEFKCYMEYGGEWHMVYRTKDQMLQLAAGLKGYNNIYCESEETGINNFLVIEK